MKPKKHFTFLTHLTVTPTTFKQAKIHKEWRQAMQAEYDALMKNQTWELVPQDSTKNVLDANGCIALKEMRMVL